MVRLLFTVATNGQIRNKDSYFPGFALGFNLGVESHTTKADIRIVRCNSWLPTRGSH